MIMEDNKLNYSLLSDTDNTNNNNYEGFYEIYKKQKEKNSNTLLKYLTSEYSIIKYLFLSIIYNPFIYLLIKEEDYFEIEMTKSHEKNLNIIHIIILILIHIYIQIMIDDIFLGNVRKIITMIYLGFNIYIFLKRFKSKIN